MTERTLHIRIESTDELFDRARVVARKIDKGEHRNYGEHLSFTDMQTYLASLTPKRLELLASLNKSGPLSIRALSKAIERDYKSVHQDVKMLMNLGLIVKRDDGLIEAPYDRIISDIRMAAA
jgi:predicted transcriptional regulator